MMDLPRDLARLERKLDAVLSLLLTLMGKETLMFDDLKAAVAANTSVVSGTVHLIQDLVAKIEGTAGDPSQLAVIVQQLKDNTQSLADAVAANTPAAPAPPATPATPATT